MAFLPRIVWLGSDVYRRYEKLSKIDSVAAEAVAVAIGSGEYNIALEWLEEGRSIVWKQMLQLRTPIDGLAAVNPALATELKQVARALDSASSLQRFSVALPSDATSLEHAAQQHRRLAERWEALVSQARQLSGFETFLLPKTAPELMFAAQSGPIVAVNVDESRCDALVLIPGRSEVSHIPLVDFSYEKATSISARFQGLVRSRGLASRGFKARSLPQNTLEQTLAVLWTDVVKPVLDALGFTVCMLQVFHVKNADPIYVAYQAN